MPSILLTPGSATVSNDNPPAMIATEGTMTPNAVFVQAAFDPDTDEHLFWTFAMPSDYSSGGSLVVLWRTTATSGNVVWAGQVSAVTAADADTPLEHAWSTAATATSAANGTEASRLVSASITLNMDSAAAGDLVSLNFSRDANNAADTCTADAILMALRFDYTGS